LSTILFSNQSAPAHRNLHSFPTRRSSDLSPSAVPTSTRLPPSVTAGSTAGYLTACWTSSSTTSRGESPAFLGRRSRRRRRKSTRDRKSTRLNSSHVKISYAVFCLKKKKNI